MQPTAKFEIDPMTVSQSVATPIGAIDLSRGDATITVTENKMQSLTVTELPSGKVTSPAVTNGGAQFTISANDTSTSITIVDDRLTSATLPVSTTVTSPVGTPVATATIHSAKR
jgi:hypothetical protein